MVSFLSLRQSSETNERHKDQKEIYSGKMRKRNSAGGLKVHGIGYHALFSSHSSLHSCLLHFSRMQKQQNVKNDK